MSGPTFGEARYAHLELVIDKDERFQTQRDIVRLFQGTRMHLSPQETFWVLAYGANLTIAILFEVNRGMYATVDLHVPSLLGGVLTAGVERFALAHNHPSNDLLPSGHDIDLTHEVMKAANVTRLHFEDHLILTPNGGHFSFADAKLLIPSKDSPYHETNQPKTRAAARSKL